MALDRPRSLLSWASVGILLLLVALAGAGSALTASPRGLPPASTTKIQASAASTLPSTVPTTTIPPTSTTSTTMLQDGATSISCAMSGAASPVSVIDGAAILTLSWSAPGEPGGPAVVQGGRIALRDNGVTLFDEALSPPNPANDSPVSEEEVSSWARGWEQALPCLEVPTAGRPLVYLNGWAAGMTCCGIVRAYYPFEQGSYISTDRDQGRAFPSEQVLDGHVVINGYNRDWNSHFTCGACRGPIQILRFQNGAYQDVTADFPTQIRDDASQLLMFTGPPYDALISLAAWAADECELGLQSAAFSRLDSMAASGQLTPPSGSSADNFGYTFTGSAYLADLHNFLRQEGYCR